MRDPLLTTRDVAQRMSTSEATVRWWRHAGTGPHGVKIGRKVFYKESDVERWIESHWVDDSAGLSA